MESETILKIVEIELLCSSNNPYFMYARGKEIDESDNPRMQPSGIYPYYVNFLICGYSHAVMFFSGHYERNYKDMTTKLSAIKYLGKKEFDVIESVINAEMNKVKLFAGTCLVLATEFDSPIKESTQSAYKVDIWLNGQNETIRFHLKSPDEYNINSVLGSHDTDFSTIQ